ncbi:pentatricopeptide repeat-containing protein At5g13270, chloroplastic [Cornus florida]|uniref:pentatricopeptide repeat-containing protein At5g13270, chloroplastic n=1 Tax=Cornus florida TaxID=4283 RepID=UPI0028A04B99|nr:pentatricopeptide repeat-containing protein At5g13270, chloroplastic [Cornus florida]
MECCTSMAGLPLLPSSPSSHLSSPDKISTIKTANFTQIPSWVSLKSNTSSIRSPQIQQGRIENIHLVSLSRQGKLKEVHDFLKEMDESGVSVSPHSFECLLETCGKLRALSDGRLIHNRMRRTVEKFSGFLENCVLQMYCDCGSFLDADKLFDEMCERSLVSWVIIISCYAQGGLLDRAFGLFSDMLVLGFKPNQSIYIALLKSLLDPSCIELGKQIHSCVIKAGLNPTVSIDTAISNMYVKCGCLESAEQVFQHMAEKNAVAWTGLMVGYTQAGKQEDALEMFAKMVKEGTQLDDFVFSIILKACAGLDEIEMGRQIHGHIVKLGLEPEVSVGTPLVDFYVKCGNMENACRAFERISEPNDVSWSAMISGHSQIGKFEEAIKIFSSLRSKGVPLNSFIYTSIFQACSAVANLNFGAQSHGDAIKRGLVSYQYGESAMITMYSKCGRLDYAFRVFELIDNPDTVAWTAIISGCAYHGKASEALRLFRRMWFYNVRPNEVTFVAVFTACSHSGLVAEAKQYLESMSSEYGVNPTIDHYDCMIDIYSRAGLLEEALELIKSMPFEPDAMSWKSLLGGCSIHRDFKLGKIAAENVLQLDPEDTAAYILMFNLYALSGKWEEAANVRKMMAERNLRKEVSCSWITVKGKMHRFIVGDRHHPQTEEIYSRLKEFKLSTIDKQNALLTEDDVSDNLPERKEQLLDHSERLAVVYGLISTGSTAPVLVFKNLRACKDCHDWAKHVSVITGREIVVRDSSRFHHFKSGVCSCGDYW